MLKVNQPHPATKLAVFRCFPTCCPTSAMLASLFHSSFLRFFPYCNVLVSACTKRFPTFHFELTKAQVQLPAKPQAPSHLHLGNFSSACSGGGFFFSQSVPGAQAQAQEEGGSLVQAVGPSSWSNQLVALWGSLLERAKRRIQAGAGARAHTHTHTCGFLLIGDPLLFSNSLEALAQRLVSTGTLLRSRRMLRKRRSKSSRSRRLRRLDFTRGVWCLRVET